MTAQVHEKLILNGEITTMMSSPTLPHHHKRLKKLWDWRIPKSSITRSSACWRKYLGTWEVKDDRFYLVSIEGMFKLRGNDPIPALWFSGELRVPRGKIIQYAHMGYHSLHEEDLFVSVENGIVVKTWIHDNRDLQNKEEVSADA